MARMDRQIVYRSGYAYQLALDHQVNLPEFRGFAVEHEWFQIEPDGTLYVRAGYAWDGLTAALDGPRGLRASLYHDVACQAVNEGLARFNLRTPHADDAFYRVMIEDGMPRFVAAYRWAFVDRWARLVGPAEPKPVLVAPLEVPA